MTPPEIKIFRKGKATPENWKKDIRKRWRFTGKKYTNQKGVMVKERSILKIC